MTPTASALGTWVFLLTFDLILAAYAPVIAWLVALVLAVVVAAKLMKPRWETPEDDT